jgi:hypothetical protein
MLSQHRPGVDGQPETTDKVKQHLALIERRLSGELNWRTALTTERPAQHPKAYTAMLKEEGLLPLYLYGPLVLTVDLFNPNNEAHDPAYDPNFEVIELLVYRDIINPWSTGYFPDGAKIDHSSIEDYRRLATYGAALGELVGLWAEILQPIFAFSEGLQYHARWLERARSSTSVKNVAPPGTTYWDYLWPLSYWSKALLDDKLAGRLKHLRLAELQLQAVDRFERVGIRPIYKELSTGGLLVQYRFILGAENRTSRARVDTPLAKQAGLRTIELNYRH